MKKIWTTVALTAALLVAGCGGNKTSYAQGVSEDEIKIGAVITSTGLYAAVGVPYGNFYKSFVAYINANQDDYADALDGKKLNSIIYDEGGDGAVGKTYVQKLINDDKVFSLVGILGTWNLVAAQAELETAGIPSVYFGTGSSYQMYEPAVGDQRYMMGVQPLYKTEGRLMYLRALTSFDNVQKIGVIHSSADDGLSLKAGIEAQAALDTRTNKPTIVYQQVTTTVAADMTSQIEAVKDCDVIIAAANQAYFKAIYPAVQTNAASRGKPIITTYVNIAPTNMPEEAVEANNSDIYGAAWVVFNEVAGSSTEADRRLADYAEYCKVVDANVGGFIPEDQKTAYKLNAYAMSSFIALKAFLVGLERVNEAKKELTPENYLEAMESERVPIAISGGVSYANGQRIGLDSLSFVKYERPAAGQSAATGTFVEVDPMTSIDQLVSQLKK